ncbi:MAG: metal ABC transporter permease [Anaerolineae bacterium]
MMNAIWIMTVGSLVAAACALPGVFLVLRGSAMTSDAISHSILFGIVGGYLLLNVESTSPVLILTAAASGVLTVWLVELLTQTGKIPNDAAIGLVFPVLFSIGVVLINTRLRDVHFDFDTVLLGSIAFAPINTMGVLGARIPEGVLIMGSILVANVILMLLFYKELKITTYDPGLAAAIGIAPALIHYGLMTMVSLTAVGSFEHVGAILVVALMIAPPATAFLLTERLDHMIGLSVGIGVLGAVSGYWISRYFGVNISGMMATMTGVFYLLALVFAPTRGLLARRIEAVQRRKRFAVEMLLVHLSQHEGTAAEASESTFAHLTGELEWSERFAERTVQRASARGLLERAAGQLRLTSAGREQAQAVLSR